MTRRKSRRVGRSRVGEDKEQKHKQQQEEDLKPEQEKEDEQEQKKEEDQEHKEQQEKELVHGRNRSRRKSRSIAGADE